VNTLFSGPKIGEILLARNYIHQADLERALDHAEGHVGEWLLNENIITEGQLARSLAEQFQLPFVELENFIVPALLFEILPAENAMQMGVLPYRYQDGELQVVISDVFELSIKTKLEVVTGKRIDLVFASAKDIKAALKRSEGTAQVLKTVSQEFKPVIVKENYQGDEETIDLDMGDKESAPVVRLVNSIIMVALQKRASDIHIEVYEHGVEAKYRIDGVLYPATDVLDMQYHSALISRLKVMAELDIAEKRLPQDGRFKLRIGHRDIDFRISILPAIYGEDVVIRILDKLNITEGMKDLSLKSLGMSDEILRQFRKAIHEPYGMVLMTGPTGSGKTTTLYAALTELNSGDEKIITIEDPVEYQLDGIVQIPVNEKKDLTFARGLRSILRHDPDKIMVGEIRDAETARIAVQSALTGHLVFTTVHANNAFDVVSRFSHMGVDVYNFVSALNCVMAQRLVRRICAECREPVNVSIEELQQSGLDPKQYADQVWYAGKGCANCNGTGYRGRAAVTEFLHLSPCIREMITERRGISEMQQAAREENMVSMRESAIEKVLDGITTLKEINRVTFVE